MFSKNQFLMIMEALYKQQLFDTAYAKLLEQTFGVNDAPCYDNSEVTNVLFKLLQDQFPPLADGTCEIEHYCFVMNFGYSDNGVQVKTFSDLWDELTVKYYSVDLDFETKNMNPNNVDAVVDDKHFEERGLLSSDGGIPEKYKQNPAIGSSED